MKTITLTDKEFDFIKGIIHTAVVHRESIREENPILKMINAISTTMPRDMMKSEAGSKLDELRRKVADDDREFTEVTVSINAKLQAAACEN